MIDSHLHGNNRIINVIHYQVMLLLRVCYRFYKFLKVFWIRSDNIDLLASSWMLEAQSVGMEKLMIDTISSLCKAVLSSLSVIPISYDWESYT